MKFLIKVYQNSLSVILSLMFGKGCRYSPTCSEYARQAIEKHGFLYGNRLTLKRISKCHPWGGFGYDPVPEKK